MTEKEISALKQEIRDLCDWLQQPLVCPISGPSLCFAVPDHGLEIPLYLRMNEKHQPVPARSADEFMGYALVDSALASGMIVGLLSSVSEQAITTDAKLAEAAPALKAAMTGDTYSFALVADRRLIVDIPAWKAGLIESPILDRQDSEDAEIVEKFYGAEADWKIEPARNHETRVYRPNVPTTQTATEFDPQKFRLVAIEPSFTSGEPKQAHDGTPFVKFWNMALLTGPGDVLEQHGQFRARAQSSLENIERVGVDLSARTVADLMPAPEEPAQDSSLSL